MNQSKSSLAFKIGSGLLVFVGVAHTGAHFAFRGGSTPEQVAVLDAMRGMHPMEGSALTLHDFYEGNSLCMGLMFFGYGSLCLLIQGALRRQGVAMPKSAAVLSAAVSAAAAAMSVRFFPVPPIVTLTAATVAFILAAVSAPAEKAAR